jgi:hypothetical protein
MAPNESFAVIPNPKESIINDLDGNPIPEPEPVKKVIKLAEDESEYWTNEF